MKRYLVLAALLVAPLAWAQEPKLTVFERLKDMASDSTNINLPKDLIRAGAGILGALGSDDKDIAKLKKLADGLNGIIVRSLEFEKEGAFTKADVQQLISELGGPGWNLIVNSSENHGQEISRVWIKIGGNGEVGGLRILSVESKELTVVSIDGKVRLEDLKDLEALGVPDINIPAPKKNEE
jgi:hypothetical protein